jgi:hypothetical protein
MSRRRKNRNIGFRAFEDTDSDILTWWESMPPGERSAALRDLIRVGIGSKHTEHDGNGHTPEITQVAEDTAWLRAAMMELPTYLEGLFSRAPMARVETQVATTIDSQPAEQPRLDQVDIDRRRANMKRSTW